MWVIPLILSEEMTEKLPEEILIQLAECSTSIIKKRVKNYLNSMEANKLVCNNCAKASISNGIKTCEVFSFNLPKISSRKISIITSGSASLASSKYYSNRSSHE